MADIPAKAGIGHPAMRFVSKTTARDMVSQLGSLTNYDRLPAQPIVTLQCPLSGSK
jgi:hypothetical protein